MIPRKLRYLRIDDEPPNSRDDWVKMLPIKTSDLSEWLHFCRDLADQQQWDYELLTIDINFKGDASGPWFPLPGLELDGNPFCGDKDPNLRGLRWSDGLLDVGPNSGLLIGAHLVSHAAHWDLPCGVAIHSNYPNIMFTDMSSAMLATQILIASGAIMVTGDSAETIGKAIGLVQQSVSRPLKGLGDAAVRFRHAFLRRAGAGSQLNKVPVRLLMQPSSLATLADIFRSAQGEDELDRELQTHGIEFYDRTGALDSLDIRSIFLDRLIGPDEYGVLRILARLPLSDVREANTNQPQDGVVWRFVESLEKSSKSRADPVLDYFRRLPPTRK